MNDTPLAEGADRPRLSRTHTQIVEMIGRRIVLGEYPVGSIVPREEDLVAELLVGRGVIREAIRVLASKGLLESRSKRGTQVLPSDQWHMLDPEVLSWRSTAEIDLKLLRDVADLRAMIEPAACAHAAVRAADSEVSLISALAREMKLVEGDAATFIEVDMQFHRALFAAAHNDLLMQIGAAIEVGLRLSREVTVSMGHGSRAEEHLEIANAIAARSAVQAQKAMSRLLIASQSDIESVLGRGWARDAGTPDPA
ncbi:FadR/GntR family transcriptional regulator [Nakamurella antarctica]|nr:FadR/GntR family transcriptional regulator [Nakamurella antarctica]